VCGQRRAEGKRRNKFKNLKSLKSPSIRPLAASPLLGSPQERGDTDKMKSARLSRSSPPFHPVKSTTTKQYIATDGTVFSERALYKSYEMKTQFTFEGRESETLVKNPGEVHGMPFDIVDCANCTILILDDCDQVQIDEVVDSCIFIGASSGSVFLRNCRNCTFTIATKQLRTRNCENCTLNLYCMTEPVIEYSKKMQFAPFNGAYDGHELSLAEAGLDPYTNKWSEVFDFSDPSKTGANWSIAEEDEERMLWCPLGLAECCIPYSNTTPRKLFTSPVKGGVVEEDDSDSHEDDPSLSQETSTNRFILLGQRLWGIMSYSISTASAFCIGLILNSIDSGRRLLTWTG
jgi:hypothetical protein